MPPRAMDHGIIGVQREKAPTWVRQLLLHLPEVSASIYSFRLQDQQPLFHHPNFHFTTQRDS